MLYVYKNIKILRQKQNMTQEELAAQIGYSDKSMIAKIEKGTVDLPLSKLIRFAEIFGVSLGELLGLETAANIPTPLTDEAFERLSAYYDKLNDLGKSEAEKRVIELSQLKPYRRRKKG